jgi:transcriptional regulator with XRE-family HTH domain
MTTPLFTDSLREWRRYRKMSQLDLAVAADVSQRHVSWLETGRSQPSRDMVLRLSEAMDVPLRDRNQFLNAAGYAPIYTESGLDEPSMDSIRHVLTDILSHHNPYPAVVLDRYWNIQMQNDAADRLFSITGDPQALWNAVGDSGEHNIALLTLHPNGLRQFIRNWDAIIGQFMRRLKREAIDSGDAKVMERYAQLENYVDITDTQPPMQLLPMLPLELQVGELRLSLCSVISSFGTAQDITANELRIETFYPTDDMTRTLLVSAASQPDA